MTIGPAPMIRIEEMSVRFGILLAISGCARHKKKARGCASFSRRRGPTLLGTSLGGTRPAGTNPARALFRPESAGREGEAVSASTGPLAPMQPIGRPIVDARPPAGRSWLIKHASALPKFSDRQSGLLVRRVGHGDG